MDTSFILGRRKVGEAVKILLDIDRVLTGDELTEIASAATEADTSAAAPATAD